MDQFKFYGPLQKVESEKRLVSGYASTEKVDLSGETVLKSAVKAALKDYMRFANVRYMHQLDAIGITKSAEVDDKGLLITAHIFDDQAWGKVKAGVLKGFSIGGKTLARDPKDRKIITKIGLYEISLVDRPDNDQSLIDSIKAGGSDGALSTGSRAVAAVKDQSGSVKSVVELWADHEAAYIRMSEMPDSDAKFERRRELSRVSEQILTLQYHERNQARRLTQADPVRNIS